MKGFIFIRFMIMALCALLVGCRTIENRYGDIKPKAPGQFRVATYNVNWGNGSWGERAPEATIAAMKYVDADLLLLQETTTKWEKLINATLASRYRYRAFYQTRNAGGLAILSKTRFRIIKRIQPAFAWYPAWQVRVQSPLGPLQVVNVHLRPSLMSTNGTGFLWRGLFIGPGVRLREMKHIVKHLKPQVPTIIAGDFNEGEVGTAGQYLVHHGYLDALLDLPRTHTWKWPGTFITFVGRFDRVFYTPPLHAARIQILHEGNSDHYPVMVDFTRVGA